MCLVINKKSRVCPLERAGGLDNKLRRLLQNPRKILGPYIREGMVVLDLGCGPGFFSIDLAHMVGKSGRVIACDVQEGMLQKLSGKIEGTDHEQRIILCRGQEDRIGISERVDFVLAFYMAHEVSDQSQLFTEIAAILRPNGQVLVVEPRFHVSLEKFEEIIRLARGAGFVPTKMPKIFLSNSVMLEMC